MRRAVVAGLAFFIGGCQTLPHDGPSARQIEDGASPSAYALVDLTYAVAQQVAANPVRPMRAFGDVSSSAPLDLIHEGDSLNATLYQAGAGPAATSGREDAADGRPQTFNLPVDSRGEVRVPFGGMVRVAGLTPVEAAGAIQSALVGRFINPQVLVSFAANVSNSVMVFGEVRSPGRIPLQPSSARLLDVITVAGGTARAPADVSVSVVRGARSASTTLAALMADADENVRLQPLDQVRLTYQPRKFSTFGAFTRAAQIPIEDDHLTLAGAISRMGGLDPNAANADSVLLFRFEKPAVARALSLPLSEGQTSAPVTYRLNLRDPSGYFIANSFEVQDGDLIYAPRADAAELRKFFELVATMSRVAYDVRVTSVLR